MSTQHAQPRWVPELTYIEYFILVLLLNKALAGIEIFEELVRQTAGKMVLSPGTLYAALKRMLAQGLIEMVDAIPQEEQTGDSRRKFYRATPAGRAQIEGMAAWMRRELTAVTEELERPSPSPAPPITTSPPPSPTERSGPEAEQLELEVDDRPKILNLNRVPIRQ